MVRLLRGAGLPLVPSPTRHRGIVVLTVRPGNPVNTVIEGFLMALRVGSLPWGR
ncbi:hypothetical protein [Vulcanisaeta sp. JCM 16161]|uniref:hypothetical protein n=1 Tax=Vulcanisaeta sp. JCM 16161 TaxID=1295372 RepID=UPI000A779DBD|nr:hypothetical protein [Vulcanisaeta sp. JCM 16161]